MKETYILTDTDREIIYKNKENIIDLYNNVITKIESSIKYEKGRVLYFSEQKITGAFANKTLFAEKAITIKSGGKVNVTIPKWESKGPYNYLTMIGDQINGQSIYLQGKDGDDYTGNLEVSGTDLLADNNVIFKMSANLGDDLNGTGDLSSVTDAVDTGIKYQYTALKDITNKEMSS